MIKKIIALMLLAFMLLSFTACDGDDQNTPDDPDNSGSPTDVAYTVKVTTLWGSGIENALVYIHKSDAEFDTATKPMLTNSDGVATFTLPESDTYSVQVVNLHERYVLPEGQGPHGRYLFDGNVADISVEHNPDYNPEYYSVGDKIEDFTVTDVNGNSHTLSELLKTKDMVMINLWFTGCGPCAAEFPVINSAYNIFKDKMEILAISDYPMDSVEKVKNYPANKGLTIDFPLVHDMDVLSPTDFGSGYYPTTVIIDRHGVICMIEIGSVTSSEEWTKTFSYFTSDDYAQRFFATMSDIPKAK